MRNSATNSNAAWPCSESIFDLGGLKARLAELDEQSQDPGLWDDSDKAGAVLRERSAVESAVSDYEKLASDMDELAVYLEMAGDGDDDATSEFAALATDLAGRLGELEVRRMLSGEYDGNNAIVNIRPGAGGTESQDWGDMLLRMYLKWAERRGFTSKILEYSPGEGAGLKSATFTLEGGYAYGYMRAESGIHRLVRISPFDNAQRRHTSFASVYVFPEIDDTIEVEINDDDLRIDTFRASGAGGQHVNKTDSAVRLTHAPSGIVVTCQNERSQHKNKATAMKILRARLYEHERQKQEARMAEIGPAKQDAAFGSQIRSYVLHPYRLVKDLRTGMEVGNADGVLDGDLDGFIEAYLMQKGG
ncbi:MAG: peptide chain release factor 2 [Pseudomonas sp.]